MKLKVDQQAGALYLSLTETPASRSEEVSPGIVVAYDDQERIIGIEMLYLSKRAPQTDVRRLLCESVPEAACGGVRAFTGARRWPPACTLRVPSPLS